LGERNGGRRLCGRDTEREAPRRWGRTENQGVDSTGQEGLSLELPFSKAIQSSEENTTSKQTEAVMMMK